MSKKDKFEGINNYALYEALSKNPIQMAGRIIELENHFRKYRIHADPNRRKAIIVRLEAAAELSETDPEAAHSDADDILLELIDDEEIVEAYGKIKKWYA